jgi:hypothetical protein
MYVCSWLTNVGISFICCLVAELSDETKLYIEETLQIK